MLDKIKKTMGYSTDLDEKIKFTYIIAGIGLMQLCIFKKAVL